MKSIKILLLAFALLFTLSNSSVFAVVDNSPNDSDTNVESFETENAPANDSPEDSDTNVEDEPVQSEGEIDAPADSDTNVDEEITPTTTEPTEETSNSSSRRNGGSKRVVNNAPQGEVLGAFTGEESCSTMYLTTYMRQGMANNVDEVKKLQTFLNEHMSAGLPVTGFFGPLTHQAVMNFQTKYAKEILTPWGITSPTGYVFKTTRAFINNLKCANSEKTPVIN